MIVSRQSGEWDTSSKRISREVGSLKLHIKVESIRFRLICIMSFLIFGTIFICWLTNQLFLPVFYQYSKINTLKASYVEVYEKLNEIDEHEESDNTNLEISLEKWSADNNISIYVIDWSRVYQMGEWMYLGEFIYPATDKMNDIEKRQILDQMGKNYGSGNELEKRKDSVRLYSDDLYSIVKVKDERLGSEYMELMGNIEIGENSHTVYMRANYESIQESVELSNQFLIYAGLGAILIGIVVMFIISGSFTKPIKKLSYIAKEMAELNFETKYTEQRNDEIGDLGHSINVLSEKLEETISELKAANNELKSDIENKIQIDEMRKEFLSNVSHELKTPIALIQGYAEGLQENINDDAESREFYCDVIIDEANKMNKMVKKLLNLNQIEFGKDQVEFERFDIVTVICSVLNSTRILFEQKEVRLIFEQTEPVYVWADEYMVEEVVTNYVSNALNHVSGEKVVEVKLVKLDGIVRVSVFNTGEQIPEDDLEKVWIKFYKVDKARTREYGGSGIGLSIVKAIMNSMHRQCGVINHENGVEFWFDLDMRY